MSQIALVYVADPKSKTALKAYGKLLKMIALHPEVTLKSAEAVFEVDTEDADDRDHPPAV